MSLQNYKVRGLNLKQLLLVTSCLSTSFASNAALFDCISEPNYCIGEGDTVIFRYQGTSSSIGLFGTVEVIGNNIVTFPTDFRAESLNGIGTVSASDIATLQVIARPGYQIDGLMALERGDYLMSGNGNVVSVTSWSEIWDWNNPVFGPSIQQNLKITGDLKIIDSDIHTWSAITKYDLTDAQWNDINSIGFTLQNNLYATTYALGDIAWIEKKIVGVGLITTPVAHAPVPAAVWLFGSGLLGLAGLARRSRKV